MARVDYKLAHLIALDPEAAKKEILEHLRAEKCHMSRTAARIGCTHGTLLGWIAKLDAVKGIRMSKAVADLKALAEKEGWHWVNIGNPYSKGRPRLSAAEKKRRAEARAKANRRVKSRSAAAA